MRRALMSEQYDLIRWTGLTLVVLILVAIIEDAKL